MRESRVPEPTDTNAVARRAIMGFITSQVIFAVDRLGVFDRLAAGPVSAAVIAAETAVDGDALERFLRVLAAESLLVEEPIGTFALTGVGHEFRRDVPGSLHHFVELMAGESYAAWAAAEHSLRTGAPAFATVHGASYFDWLAARPDEQRRFNDAQAGLVERRLEPLLDRDWSAARTVVDVGGGSGRLLSRLLPREPHLNGILVDLPHVAAQAAEALAADGLAERCRCVGGDFFGALPKGGDVYVLAQILHDWDDEAAAKILRRCHAAIPAGGRLLILEQVIREDGRPHPAKQLDLHMLLMLGGRERTESAWRRLLREGGFSIESVVQSARSSLIEAVPAHGHEEQR
jgi:SAM-dependent methyltransferase